MVDAFGTKPTEYLRMVHRTDFHRCKAYRCRQGGGLFLVAGGAVDAFGTKPAEYLRMVNRTDFYRCKA
ncbi:hypothetical protein DIPPA_04309 [Diplonema papillatum]|nr:hypothetical protein DIPPA_04309 [Diplonema papillatum]